MSNKLCTTRIAVITLALVSLLAFTFYSFELETIYLTHFNFPKVNKNAPPIILLYNTWSKNPITGPQWRSLGEDLWELTNCPVNCVYSANRNKYEIIADLILVTVAGTGEFGHSQNNMKNHLSRWDKNSKQMWVAGNLEPPRYFARISDETVDHSFHWTASYRSDSHVYWPYAQLRSVNRSVAIRPPGDLRKKKLVAWLVSRCDAASERQIVVNTLQQYVPVDVYGRCGSQCPETANQSCRQFLNENYKFYLAFENSFCFEYVTEKFYYALGGMVPITLGWSNYSNIAPPNSFINALNYKSVQELAAYLKWLDSNDKEYLKYFEWTQSYEVDGSTIPIGLCSACKSYRHYTNDSEDFQLPDHIRGASDWFYNLPVNPDGTAGTRTFHVGGVDINVQNVCLDPCQNETLSAWIRGKNLPATR